VLKHIFAQISDRNAWVLMTFCVFILAQFVFALVYYLLYCRNRANFAFNRDILTAQIATNVARFEELRRQALVLRELMAELERGTLPLTSAAGPAVKLGAGHVCTMRYNPPQPTMPGPSPAGSSSLEIVDPQGHTILRVSAIAHGFRGRVQSAIHPSSNPEWRFVVSDIVKRFNKRLDQETRRMASLSTPEPDIWSYWDFLYFSVIIQTTVGLGDILPNSTAVRLVVAGQVVFGYGLLVVVLNIVFGGT